MAADSLGAESGRQAERPAPVRGPLDGWVGALRSEPARKVFAVMACVVAVGWLVAVCGAALVVIGASPLTPGEAQSVSAAPARAKSDGSPATAIVDVSAPAIVPSPAPESPVAPDRPDLPTAAPAVQPTLPRSAIVAAPGLRLRDLPTIQGRVLQTLPPGAAVAILDSAAESDGLRWVPVRVTGDRLGWVASDGLE